MSCQGGQPKFFLLYLLEEGSYNNFNHDILIDRSHIFWAVFELYPRPPPANTGIMAIYISFLLAFLLSVLEIEVISVVGFGTMVSAILKFFLQ